MTENRRVAERLFQALIDQDLEGFHGLLHEDSVIGFPQSGERIVREERRRAVYRSFPGAPSVRRILTGAISLGTHVHLDMRLGARSCCSPLPGWACNPVPEARGARGRAR